MSTREKNSDLEEPEGGNIKTPSAKHRGRSWFLTWNNYSEENVTQLTQHMGKYADRYMIQEELAESGTRHLQGFFVLNNATSETALWNKFDKMYCRKLKSEEGAMLYCSKEETRNGRQWIGGYPEEVPDPLEGKELKRWQAKILKKISADPHDRKIYWYWEEKGRVGKTTLAKHICLKNKDAIYVGGKASDVKCAIAKIVEEGRNPRIVMFDFPRSCRDYVSYQALEEVKNGIFFSGKYESGMCLFKIPHVLVFANFSPAESMLSADRWCIRKIK